MCYGVRLQKMKTVLALLVLATICCACSRPGITSMQSTHEKSGELKIISVELNAAPATVIGIDWATEDTKIIEEPHTVKIRFPSGRVYQSYSKLTILDQKDNHIQRIKILPMDDVGSFEG